MRDLVKGDVVNHYGTRQVVAAVEHSRDTHGYPTVYITFADGTYIWHPPQYAIEVVE